MRRARRLAAATHGWLPDSTTLTEMTASSPEDVSRRDAAGDRRHGLLATPRSSEATTTPTPTPARRGGSSMLHEPPRHARRAAGASERRARSCRGRHLGRLVLGEAALHDRAGEHADEPAVLDHRHALEVARPRARGTPRRAGRSASSVKMRRLGDLAERRRRADRDRGDDLAHERLPRHDAREPAVAVA